jgi:hypothetical protein
MADSEWVRAPKPIEADIRAVWQEDELPDEMKHAPGHRPFTLGLEAQAWVDSMEEIRDARDAIYARPKDVSPKQHRVLTSPSHRPAPTRVMMVEGWDTAPAHGPGRWPVNSVASQGSSDTHQRRTVFTAAELNTPKTIEALCRRYTFDRLYVGEAIPPDKLRAAREALRIPAAEPVIALCDTTWFHSAKRGLAICENGIFWKNSRSDRHHVPWATFMALSSTPIVKKFEVTMIGNQRFEAKALSEDAEMFRLLGDIQQWLIDSPVAHEIKARSTASQIFAVACLAHVRASVVTYRECSDDHLAMLSKAPVHEAIALISRVFHDFETPNGLHPVALHILVRMLEALQVSPSHPGYPGRLRLYYLADVVRRSAAIPAVGLEQEADIRAEADIHPDEAIYDIAAATLLEPDSSARDVPPDRSGIELRLPKFGEPFIIGTSSGSRLVGSHWVTRLRGALVLTDRRLLLHPPDGWATVSLPLGDIASCRAFEEGIRVETSDDANLLIFVMKDMVKIETLALLTTYLVTQQRST